MRGLRALLCDDHVRRGARGMLLFLPGVAAWGLVTGVAMVKSGLSPALALAMTVVVYAGSAQLASLPLLAAGAPLPVVLAAAACVNLRFVIYSAQRRDVLDGVPRARRVALGFFAADLNIIGFQRDWPRMQPAPGQARDLVGSVAAVWVLWQVTSIAGILLGDAIPTAWGLGFAGTLSMLGLAHGLIRDRTTWIAAAVAGAAAVASFALPLKLNIVVAIAAAAAAGLLAEQAGRAWRVAGAPRR